MAQLPARRAYSQEGGSGFDITPASGSEGLQLGEKGGFGRRITHGIME